MNRTIRWFSLVGLLLMTATADACPFCRLGSSYLVGAYNLGIAPPDTQSTSSATTRPSTQSSNDSPHSASQTSPPPAPRLPLGLSIVGGADVTTAYYHRGYLMGDHGAITQPFLTICRPFVMEGQLSVTPYVGLWTDLQSNGTRNSGHNNGTAISGDAVATMFCCASRPTGKASVSSPWITPPDVPVPAGQSAVLLPGGPGGSASTTAVSTASSTRQNESYGLYEADVTAGVTFNANPFSLDLRYTAYTYPDGALSGYQEVGAKFSIDLVPFLMRKDGPEGFIIRPFVEIDQETNGLNRGNFTYIESGIEPSFDLPIGRTRLGISLPVTIGLSGAEFFTNANGSNDPLGYISAGMKASLPLPVPDRFGQWYLTGTVTYLHLDAYNLITLNGGRQDEVIASLGLSFRL